MINRFTILISGVMSFALALSSGQAAGFVLHGVLDNGTPNDLTDDLLGAARWSNVPGSLVGSGTRGLGGGLEYSIATDFCAKLIPKFIDTPKPKCSQVRSAIRKAFNRWSLQGSALRFTNISGQIAPLLPPPDDAEPWAGFGAEIDLFALSSRDHPEVSRYGALTYFYYSSSNPVGTSGLVLTGKTITSADIIFSTNACYHLSPRWRGRGCNHFESLMLHEIGHALALDHPNQFPQRNFVKYQNSINDIPNNYCENPIKDFQLSPNIDPQAVMNSSLGQPEPVSAGLTSDDLTGLKFLYPLCSKKINQANSAN
jgi:hypothetical protein